AALLITLFRAGRVIRIDRATVRNVFLILKLFASKVRPARRAQPTLRRAAYPVRAAALVVAILSAFFVCRSARAQIQLPATDPRVPIVVEAEHANHWTEGAADVWIISGNAHIAQGKNRASAKQAVLWIEHQPTSGLATEKVVAYLDGKVSIDSQ